MSLPSCHSITTSSMNQVDSHYDTVLCLPNSQVPWDSKHDPDGTQLVANRSSEIANAEPNGCIVWCNGIPVEHRTNSDQLLESIRSRCGSCVSVFVNHTHFPPQPFHPKQALENVFETMRKTDSCHATSEIFRDQTTDRKSCPNDSVRLASWGIIEFETPQHALRAIQLSHALELQVPLSAQQLKNSDNQSSNMRTVPLVCSGSLANPECLARAIKSWESDPTAVVREVEEFRNQHAKEYGTDVVSQRTLYLYLANLRQRALLPQEVAQVEEYNLNRILHNTPSQTFETINSPICTDQNPKAVPQQLDTNDSDINSVPQSNTNETKPISVQQADMKESNPKSVLILTAFTEDYSVGYLCAAINRMYAKRHNYEIVVDILSKSDMLDAIHPRNHCTWYKVVMINRVLNDPDMFQKFSYIVWIDADAVVVNQQISILDDVVYQRGRGKKLVIAEDLTSCCSINAGVLITKCCEWSKTLWRDVWNSKKYHLTTFYEQSALLKWLETHGEKLSQVNGPFHSFNGGYQYKYTPNVAVLPHNELNCNKVDAPPAFIFHAVGLSKYKAVLGALQQLGLDVPPVHKELELFNCLGSTQLYRADKSSTRSGLFASEFARYVQKCIKEYPPSIVCDNWNDSTRFVPFQTGFLSFNRIDISTNEDLIQIAQSLEAISAYQSELKHLMQQNGHQVTTGVVTVDLRGVSLSDVESSNSTLLGAVLGLPGLRKLVVEGIVSGSSKQTNVGTRKDLLLQEHSVLLRNVIDALLCYKNNSITDLSLSSNRLAGEVFVLELLPELIQALPTKSTLDLRNNWLSNDEKNQVAQQAKLHGIDVLLEPQMKLPAWFQ